jgi:hypothetical protein
MAQRIIFTKAGAPDREGFDLPHVHELMAKRGYEPRDLSSDDAGVDSDVSGAPEAPEPPAEKPAKARARTRSRQTPPKE